jgi:hypothetical protein
MKKLIVILTAAFVLFSMNSVQAQFSKVPSVTTEAFKAKYANTKNVEWKDKVSYFQANFEMGGEKYESKFNSKGEFLGSEKVIEKEVVPAAVKDGFAKSKFSDWDVKSVTWIERKDSSIEYRYFIRKSGVEKKYLTFNDKGKLVKEAITI